jgi:hypothetical protein
MTQKTCLNCRALIEQTNKACISCGYHLVLEPKEEEQKRYLKGPSLGAIFFTQGWAFGARLYLWFLLAFIPIIGFVVLFILFFFGRRLSWKTGGWQDWESFRKRMSLMDKIAIGWILLLVGIYFYRRYT